MQGDFQCSFTSLYSQNINVTRKVAREQIADLVNNTIL